MTNKNSYNEFDFTVVGAGILGLSTALEYQKKFPNKKILIIEKESNIFKHQSGRNSGVIHSGIYYKPGSFKAKNCIKGYKKLISFADKYSIPYEITGKLIVAVEKNQIYSLKTLLKYGNENGLTNLKLLNKEEIQKIEPYCTNSLKALYVPQAGIIDYNKVGFKLVELLKKGGSSFCFKTEVIDIINRNKCVEIKTKKKSIYSKKTVVCGGVYSDRFIFSSLKKKIRIFPFRGEYFRLRDSASYKVNGLIYPAPDLNFPFLGVHFTKTINQRVEAGPNAVLTFSREGYKKYSFKWKDFNQILMWRGFWIFAFRFWKVGIFEIYRSFSKKAFTNSLKKLIPSITIDDLETIEPGIRAQALSIEGELLDDFQVEQNKNIINVINAPSPAATSCFAIAADIIKKINNG
tara:strand:- start:21834 stop:23048 length:1215 start_codon:yes stop_codon:yes gene_type:complete